PQVPPTTVLPLTPKIGMGKPAISKRKFSPGRARVKQGSWWSNRRAVSPPSSSQDSTGEGGWDSPKPRPPDSPLWSMRVVREGSSLTSLSVFPCERRRQRKEQTEDSGQSDYVTWMWVRGAAPAEGGGGELDAQHGDVMFSTSDHFTLRQ
ncbi:histone-lysine N-methyltransferase 2C-like protein, partial [Lates japonicus]